MVSFETKKWCCVYVWYSNQILQSGISNTESVCSCYWDLEDIHWRTLLHIIMLLLTDLHWYKTSIFKLYEPSKEERAQAWAKHIVEDALLEEEQFEKSVKQKCEERRWTPVRKCTECYPAFYPDECPDTGYRASVTNVCPDIKGSCKKYFFGTPFHAWMIGIYN